MSLIWHKLFLYFSIQWSINFMSNWCLSIIVSPSRQLCVSQPVLYEINGEPPYIEKYLNILWHIPCPITSSNNKWVNQLIKKQHFYVLKHILGLWKIWHNADSWSILACVSLKTIPNRFSNPIYVAETTIYLAPFNKYINVLLKCP